jgi:hypothetical protein
MTGGENQGSDKQINLWKRFFAVISLLLFATVLMNCAANEKKLNEEKLQESGAQLLTQQDLIKIFSEKQAAKFTVRSGNASIYYFPDGTQRIAWKSGEDDGIYRIKNGQFCSKWKKLRHGKEACYKIYRSGDNEFTWVNIDGSYDSTMAFMDYF